MTDTEALMQAVTQVVVEAAKAIIKAIMEASEGSRTSTQSAGHITMANSSRTGGWCLKQSTFNLTAKGNFMDFEQFEWR